MSCPPPPTPLQTFKTNFLMSFTIPLNLDTSHPMGSRPKEPPPDDPNAAPSDFHAENSESHLSSWADTSAARWEKWSRMTEEKQLGDLERAALSCVGARVCVCVCV